MCVYVCFIDHLIYCSCSFVAHVHLFLMFICCLCPFAQAKDIKDNGSLCLWNLDCVLSRQQVNITYLRVFYLRVLLFCKN